MVYWKTAVFDLRKTAVLNEQYDPGKCWVFKGFALYEVLQKSTPFGRGGLPRNRDVLHFVIFAEIRKSTPNLHHFCRNRRKSRKIAHLHIGFKYVMGTSLCFQPFMLFRKSKMAFLIRKYLRYSFFIWACKEFVVSKHQEKIYNNTVGSSCRSSSFTTKQKEMKSTI